MFFMRYQRASLNRVRDAAAKHPSVSLAMRVLLAIIGISLLITIAFTILLIPVSLLGLLVLGIAVFYAWIAIGVEVMLSVEQRWRLKVKPETRAFDGVLILIGSMDLLSRLSRIGGLLLLLVSCLGLGAVFLTRFRLHRFEPATNWEDTQHTTYTNA